VCGEPQRPHLPRLVQVLLMHRRERSREHAHRSMITNTAQRRQAAAGLSTTVLSAFSAWPGFAADTAVVAWHHLSAMPLGVVGSVAFDVAAPLDGT
jgi:hypothetical protein